MTATEPAHRARKRTSLEQSKETVRVKTRARALPDREPQHKSKKEPELSEHSRASISEN